MPTAIQYAKQSITELSRGRDTDQIRKIATIMQREYGRRLRNIEKSGEVSQALISLEKSGGVRDDLSSLSRNQLIHEVSKYRQFLTSKTSSVKGIRQVNREQDKLIFGTDSRGRAKHRMSNEERERYWALYNEYLASDRASRYRFGSDRLLSVVGEVHTRDLDLGDSLTQIAKELKLDYEEQNNDDWGSEVFRKLGIDFQW